MSVNDVLLHIDAPISEMAGLGFTVTVSVKLAPVQLPVAGLIV